MTEEVPALPTHRRAWTAAIAAFLIHNVEEVSLDLPGWREQHPVLPWPGWLAAPGGFTIAVGVVSLVMSGAALYAIATAPRWSRVALIVFALAMLANAASHIALSIMTASLMPGAVSAGLLIAPVFAGVLWAIRR